MHVELIARLRTGRIARLGATEEVKQVAEKRSNRLTWDRVEQLAELLVRAIEPVTRLIEVISRIR